MRRRSHARAGVPGWLQRVGWSLYFTGNTFPLFTSHVARVDVEEWEASEEVGSAGGGGSGEGEGGRWGGGNEMGDERG